jgi:hypothetical protein
VRYLVLQTYRNRYELTGPNINEGMPPLIIDLQYKYLFYTKDKLLNAGKQEEGEDSSLRGSNLPALQEGTVDRYLRIVFSKGVRIEAVKLHTNYKRTGTGTN